MTAVFLLILTLLLKLRIVAWTFALIFLIMGGIAVFRRMGNGKSFIGSALGTAAITAALIYAGFALPDLPLWYVLFA